ncbi:hypothetical protein [Streptomyces bungoensis]|uniref:hypothetical protein n=1 Tax=Streptomyces bungoensis TaxID=285568 RepID=UPI0033D9BE53
MSDTQVKRISAANKSAAHHGLQSAVVMQANKLRLDLPKGKDLIVSTYAHASKPFACDGQYSCDRSLRSGLTGTPSGSRAGG